MFKQKLFQTWFFYPIIATRYPKFLEKIGHRFAKTKSKNCASGFLWFCCKNGFDFMKFIFFLMLLILLLIGYAYNSKQARIES